MSTIEDRGVPTVLKEERIRGFISYSHANTDDAARLDVHLRATERTLPIVFWRDQRNLHTGQSLDHEIEAAIELAHIFVLAITPDFFNSDYIFEQELPAIRRRCEEVNGLILAIVIRRCRWREFLGTSDLVAAPLDPAGNLLPVRDWQGEDGFDAAGEQCHQAIKRRYALGAVSVLARQRQQRGGLTFEPEVRTDGKEPQYFTFSADVAADDEKVAMELTTRQRQQEACTKAESLSDRTKGLGNDAIWFGLTSAATRTMTLLQGETANLPGRAFELWSLSQSLATYAAQDDRLTKIPAAMRNGNILAPEQRRALDDVLATLPVLVRRFPSVGRDDELLREEYFLHRNDTEEFLEKVESLRLLGSSAASTVKALRQSPTSNTASAGRRVSATLVRTSRNIGNAALGFAASWVARAYERVATGNDPPKTTELDQKTHELVTKGQIALAGLYGDIPDMARAVDVLSERITNRLYTPPTGEDDSASALPLVPPSDFSLRNVVDLVIQGKSIPDEWVPFINALDFRGEWLVELEPLSHLVQLQRLSLDSAPIQDLIPIARLTLMQELNLNSTHVYDLSPITNLTRLRMLYFASTQVHRLDPLTELKLLQRLSLAATPVESFAPLAQLAQLQAVYLDSTRVVDLSPIRHLGQLQTLSLTSTKVADLAPLAKLTRLESLYLNSTQVTDLKPISGLTRLKTLSLAHTNVTDLRPLEGLEKLQTLSLISARVDDLGPVADLPQLNFIRGAATTSIRSLGGEWESNGIGDLIRRRSSL